jgi:hypothetical protein
MMAMSSARVSASSMLCVVRTTALAAARLRMTSHVKRLL